MLRGFLHFEHSRAHITSQAPLRVVELVAVVIRWNYVEHNIVLGILVQSPYLHFDGREDSPEEATLVTWPIAFNLPVSLTVL